MVWAKGIGSTGTDAVVAIVADVSGNVVITGQYQYTPDFDPGPDTALMSGPASGSHVFLAQYDSLGNYIWSREFGSNTSNVGNDLYVNSLGDIHITGKVDGFINFGAGTLITTGTDIFYAKYASSGSHTWSNLINSADPDMGYGITLDDSDNVFIVGYFTGYGTPPTCSLLVTSNGFYDAIFSKFDSNGNCMWTKNVGGSGFDAGYDISLDADGNVYIVGYFSGTADFDPDDSTNYFLVSSGQNAFFAKYDPMGNFIWANSLYGGSSRGLSIANDDSGNVFITGRLSGTADFDPGAGTYNLTASGNIDIFLAKYDSSGNFLWAQNFGTSSTNIGTNITLDKFNDVYITGSFTNTVDFNPSGTGGVISSSGGADAFFAKYDAAGNFIWVKRVGGTSAEVSNSIFVDSSLYIYIGGSYGDTADFDPGPGTYTLSSIGPYDLYFAKYSQGPCPLPTVNFGNSNSYLVVSFFDSSTFNSFPVRNWDFGDGSPLDTSLNPVHTYSLPGTYNVCLTVYDQCGADTLCNSITVNCITPTGGFSSSLNGFTASFIDSSVMTGTTNWLWDFGDSSGVDTSQNPTYTYTLPGNYDVCLTVSDICGTETICDSISVVCVPPISNYSFSSTPNEFSVTFSDLSTTNGVATWYWDYGDGTMPDTIQNSTHIFSTFGLHTVCLTVTDACGSDTICNNLFLSCIQPISYYTYSSNFYDVTFMDSSIFSNLIQRSWDFGDGTPLDTSTNPVHTYSDTGSYLVCLIIDDLCGIDSFCSNVVVACPAPSADFNYNINNYDVVFSDLSSISQPSSWLWSYGDGGADDSIQNPSHTYLDTGSYTVCLFIQDYCGYDTNCLNIVIIDSTVSTTEIDMHKHEHINWIPNPFYGSTTLHYEVKEADEVYVWIYDPLGNQIHFGYTQKQTGGKYMMPIQFDKYACGIYYYRVKIGNYEKSGKLVLIRQKED